METIFRLRHLLASLVAAFLLAACGGQTLFGPPPTFTQAPPSPAPTSTTAPEGGEYHNLFRDLLGKSDTEVQGKIEDAWQHFFYGDDDTQRVYYPVGEDMAYIEDIGNGDVRSEGMSYGMMIAVQMDKQEEFDRLWKWAKTYMYQSDGPYIGYFAWHCNVDGTQIDANPASDGEEWFVTALFFAAGRWGNGDGIYDYEVEANAILHTMLHKQEEGTAATNNTSFRFDAWRTTMNIAVDDAWFGADEWEVEQSNRMLSFFYEEGIDAYANQYTLAGESLSSDHSPGLVAMNAVGALAATTEHRAEFVEELWDLRLPSGKWRYYDGMLYMLGLLHVSGQFKIYEPITS